jgi:hypothetical protein
MSLLLTLATTTAPSDTGWTDLTLLDWNAGGLEMRIGGVWLLVAVLVLAALWCGRPWIRRRLWSRLRTKSVKLSFLGQEVEICPDHETRRIAYQAWVEIRTRKVGLPFEQDDDVIVEVYNSWYQLFGVLRDLCKSIPAECLVDDANARRLVELLLRSINEGLRPHLTRWQAKFRRWYSAAIARAENADRAPQVIQRDYPEYEPLLEDLCRVNGVFVEFAESLLKLVQNNK